MERREFLLLQLRTNGAHRLHPVEWNIGEAATTLAWFTMKNGVGIEQVAADPVLTRCFQGALLDQGIALEWFDDLPLDDPAFRDIQLAALAGLYPMNERDLHASPEALVTRAEAAQILTRLHRKPEVRDSKVPIDVPADHPAKRTIWTALEYGWMASGHRNWFHPDLPMYWSDLRGWMRRGVPGR